MVYYKDTLMQKDENIDKQLLDTTLQMGDAVFVIRARKQHQLHGPYRVRSVQEATCTLKDNAGRCARVNRCSIIPLRWVNPKEIE